MNPSHITPAPDIYSNIIKYIYSNAKNLKLITNIKKLSNTIGCKPETILLIINKHSKLTTLSCNNTIAIRIKQ